MKACNKQSHNIPYFITIVKQTSQCELLTATLTKVKLPLGTMKAYGRVVIELHTFMLQLLYLRGKIPQ
jgi:hypothetical protein